MSFQQTKGSAQHCHRQVLLVCVGLHGKALVSSRVLSARFLDSDWQAGRQWDERTAAPWGQLAMLSPVAGTVMVVGEDWVPVVPVHHRVEVVPVGVGDLLRMRGFLQEVEQCPGLHCHQHSHHSLVDSILRNHGLTAKMAGGLDYHRVARLQMVLLLHIDQLACWRKHCLHLPQTSAAVSLHRD